jgi:hypothetical protein
MPFFNAQLNPLLDGILNGTNFVGLLTTLPSYTAGTGAVEVTGGSYARVSLSPAFPASSGNATTDSKGFYRLTSNADLGFVKATANWGTVLGYGIFDASTAGNLLGAFPLTDVPVDATYSQTTTTVTVTKTGHGLTTSNQVEIKNRTGTVVAGIFTITVVDANTFTYTTGASQTASGGCTYGLLRSTTISNGDVGVFSTGNLSLGVK